MKISGENYVAIQGWMRTELGLKGNDLLVYAVIYGFSQIEDQRFKGSLQYLADWCGASRQGIQKNIKSLLDKNVVRKYEYMKNDVKFIEYEAVRHMEQPDNSVAYSTTELHDMLYNSVVQHTTKYDESVQLSCTNNIINNKDIYSCAPKPHDNIFKDDMMDNRVLETEAPVDEKTEENQLADNTEEVAQPDKEEQLKHDFEIIYALYPKKVGRTLAFSNYKQWVSQKGKYVGGHRYRLTNRQIYRAVQKYIKQQEEDGSELKFWKNFDTLMGRQLLDYVELEEGRI